MIYRNISDRTSGRWHEGFSGEVRDPPAEMSRENGSLRIPGREIGPFSSNPATDPVGPVSRHASGARVSRSQEGLTEAEQVDGGVVGAAIDTTGALAAWSNHDFDRGTAGFHCLDGAPICRRELRRRSPALGAHRPPWARAHLLRHHRTDESGKSPRARTADLAHRLNRVGQRSLMTLPVMSAAASEAR